MGNVEAEENMGEGCKIYAICDVASATPNSYWGMFPAAWEYGRFYYSCLAMGRNFAHTAFILRQVTR